MCTRQAGLSAGNALVALLLLVGIVAVLANAQIGDFGKTGSIVVAKKTVPSNFKASIDEAALNKKTFLSRQDVIVNDVFGNLHGQILRAKTSRWENDLTPLNCTDGHAIAHSHFCATTCRWRGYEITSSTVEVGRRLSSYIREFENDIDLLSLFGLTSYARIPGSDPSALSRGKSVTGDFCSLGCRVSLPFSRFGERNVGPNQFVGLLSGRLHFFQLAAHRFQLTTQNIPLRNSDPSYHGGKNRNPNSSNSRSTRRTISGVFLLLLGAALMNLAFYVVDKPQPPPLFRFVAGFVSILAFVSIAAGVFIALSARLDSRAENVRVLAAGIFGGDLYDL